MTGTPNLRNLVNAEGATAPPESDRECWRQATSAAIGVITKISQTIPKAGLYTNLVEALIADHSVEYLKPEDIENWPHIRMLLLATKAYIEILDEFEASFTDG